jgi:hypothetical protein
MFPVNEVNTQYINIDASNNIHMSDMESINTVLRSNIIEVCKTETTLADDELNKETDEQPKLLTRRGKLRVKGIRKLTESVKKEPRTLVTTESTYIKDIMEMRKHMTPDEIIAHKKFLRAETQRRFNQKCKIEGKYMDYKQRASANYLHKARAILYIKYLFE